jgi:antitoxin FitA
MAAEKPKVEDVIKRARERVEATGTRADAATIVDAKDADKR